MKPQIMPRLLPLFAAVLLALLSGHAARQPALAERQITLTASAASVPVGTAVTFRASATGRIDKDIGVVIRKGTEHFVGPGEGIASCSTSECSGSLTLQAAATIKVTAQIWDYYGGAVLATSAPVTVTWIAQPTPTPTFTPTATATPARAAAPLPTPTFTPTATATATPTGTATPKILSTAPQLSGRPLCPEALLNFSPEKIAAARIADPGHSGIRFDGEELAGQLQAALKSHDAGHPDNRAYVSDGTPFGGTVGAASWLSVEGGLAPERLSNSYVTGKEQALADAIAQLSGARKAEGKPPLLSPGDVFQLALAVNDGNVNGALLTAHNTLRHEARGDATVQTVGGLTRAPGFVDNYLVKLRDNADNGGVWYHLFGTAYFEVVAKGDWGPWIGAAGSVALVTTGLATGPIGAALLAAGGALYGAGGAPSGQGTTAFSRFANFVEQIYREGAGGRAPDPEKYCFNVWGAQIGRQLYKGLPYKGTRDIRAFFSRFAMPAPVIPLEPPRLPEWNPRYINIMGSPFSVEWKGSGGTMVLDQGPDPLQALLVGGGAQYLTPFLEGDSWGVLWLDGGEGPTQVTFEAIRPGATLHFLRVDTTTGETAEYQATASRQGERFTVSLDPGTVAPRMTQENGAEIVPVMVTLDLAQSGGAPAGSQAAGGTDPVFVLAGLGIGAVVVVSIVAIARSRRRARRASGVGLVAAKATSPTVAATPGCCPRCATPAWPEAMFCHNCGELVAQTLQPIEPAGDPRCDRCGTEGRAGARFCRKCGAELPDREPAHGDQAA
jgi:hypothetical protein